MSSHSPQIIKTPPHKSSSTKLLELKDVWKTYHLGETDLHVLRGISLHIKEGEFVAIIGPSGSGKSTLMNMIGLLDIPSKGHVVISGKDIATLSESELAKLRGKKIGFIFQQFNLIPTLSALENVILPTIFQGTREEDRIKLGSTLLKQVGLHDRMDHRPSQLSGGQQQRVAIARSLANNPEIILADEPTGNLDSSSGQAIMEMISNLHQQGKTIVLITHDPQLIKFATRIIHIKDGVVEKETHI